MLARRLALIGLVIGCGGGGGDTPIDARDIDARVPDHDGSIDAGPDAEIPDAEVPDAALVDAGIDAEVPDAEVPDAGDPGCVVPPFTTGVSTLAGCGESGAIDGARDVARFFNPVNVARGPGNELYVADFDNHRIRVVDALGNVRTLVQQASFQRPFGLAFAEDATLYVQTDRNDSGVQNATTGTIWRVNIATGAATVVVRDIGRPRGILVLPEPDGRIVLSDYLHQTVRLLDPDTGDITPLAGATDLAGAIDDNGAAARFFGPYGVALMSDGRIAVADLFNNRIRAVELDGDVTTLAGTGVSGDDDGAAGAATFAFPQDVATDAAGNVYVADTDNHVVRLIAGGQVTTIVGTGEPGADDDDDLRAASLYGLEGLDVSADGATLWIADGSRGEDAPYHRVRVVDLDGP